MQESIQNQQPVPPTRPEVQPTPPIQTQPQSKSKSPLLFIAITFNVLLLLILGVGIYYSLTKDNDDNKSDTNIITTTCDYNNTTYNEGESFDATDGCNTCTCSEGQIGCTKIGCKSEQPPANNTIEFKYTYNDQDFVLALQNETNQEFNIQDNKLTITLDGGAKLTITALAKASTGGVSCNLNSTQITDDIYRLNLADYVDPVLYRTDAYLYKINPTNALCYSLSFHDDEQGNLIAYLEYPREEYSSNTEQIITTRADNLIKSYTITNFIQNQNQSFNQEYIGDDKTSLNVNINDAIILTVSSKNSTGYSPFSPKYDDEYLTLLNTAQNSTDGNAPGSDETITTYTFKAIKSTSSTNIKVGIYQEWDSTNTEEVQEDINITIQSSTI